MEDRDIVDLYWQRDETAITATANKYGAYCRTVALNILRNEQDAEECLNDTYIRAWNSMPSHRPQRLAPYLGKLSRWLALDRLEKRSCQKRGGDSTLSLEAAEELPSANDCVQNELEFRELCAAIERFLSNQRQEDRQVFLARYWYMADIQEIACQFHFSESKVKSMLMRTRNRLMKFLKEEGLC